MVAWASLKAEARALARAILLGVMRYRVMVGQQLQFAAEPGKLIDSLRSLGRARVWHAAPLPFSSSFSFFFSLLSERRARSCYGEACVP